MNEKRILHEQIINWNWTEKGTGESGVKIVSKALKINTTLTKLDLSGDE